MTEKEGRTRRGLTRTILVAEDDTVLRNLMASVLDQFGYTTITAKNGVEALEKYFQNRDRIDLLVFDVIMPYKDGKAAYDEIRKSDPHIKALFISGYDYEKIIKKGILEKGIHYIPKPFNPERLISAVRELFGDS